MTWRLGAAVIAAALLAAACGDDGDGGDASPAASPQASTATPAATATPTVSPAPTATAGAESAFEEALWPSPDQRVDDPGKVARAFVTDYIGLADPHLGEFSETEPGAGEVAVFRTGEGGRRLDTVAAVIRLRQIDGDGWFVTSAKSDEVRIAEPEALAPVSSPVTVAGRARGFEGNVVLQLRPAFSAEPLAEEPVIAGAGEDLEPFSATLEFQAPGTATGGLVAMTGSGAAAVDAFAALPVRFGG